MPREARSVATSTRALPRLKLSSAFWRAFWLLLPWIASDEHAPVLQRLGDAIGAALGAGEDDDALERGIGQQMAEQRALGRGVHEVDALVDLLDGAALRRDLDLLGILQDLVGELGDVARHGGREQQRLALLGDQLRDAAHVLDEAHVEHAIGFVEDEEASPGRASRCRARSGRADGRAWRPGCRRRAAGSRSGGRSPGHRRRCRGAGRGRVP